MKKPQISFSSENENYVIHHESEVPDHLPTFMRKALRKAILLIRDVDPHCEYRDYDVIWRFTWHEDDASVSAGIISPETGEPVCMEDRHYPEDIRTFERPLAKALMSFYERMMRDAPIPKSKCSRCGFPHPHDTLTPFEAGFGEDSLQHRLCASCVDEVYKLVGPNIVVDRTSNPNTPPKKL